MQSSVCVLLCTYNGGKYLPVQLDSIKNQQGVNVEILAHDDGSNDNTLDVLGQYGINVMGGEHLGAAHGFFYLMEQAPEADFYAFCDQDDRWDTDKLANAAERLKDAAGPALYCCSTRLVDDNLNFIKDHVVNAERSLESRLFYASISGNTIVFNKALKDLAVRHHPEKMVMHDSWMVKLCIAVGGTFIVDEKPHIDYRMHGNNVVGMELNFSQKLGKFKTVVESRGEGQELIDICGYYDEMVLPKYKRLAGETLMTRTDKSARKSFMRNSGVDFKSKGFNVAFAMKVMRGNL